MCEPLPYRIYKFPRFYPRPDLETLEFTPKKSGRLRIAAAWECTRSLMPSINIYEEKTYKVSMHCTSCAMVIESDLEDTGVKAVCSYAKQTLEVEFDDTRVGEHMIHNIVIKAGYTIL